MGAMYGKQPLPVLAFKGCFNLSNGMYCVFGKTTEGLCVDVYRDKSMKDLVSMQHGIITNLGTDENDYAQLGESLQMLMESMIDEFA